MSLLDSWRPPRIVVDGDLAWTLGCAYGPSPDGAFVLGAPAQPERAMELALALGLGARIAARWPRQELEAWLGEAPASRLIAAHRGALAAGLRVEAALSRLIQDAAETGVALVPLKFAALSAAGIIQPGSREVSDLDVLVAPGELQGFEKKLVSRGYRRSRGRGYEHHPGPLVTPAGVSLEIHRRLPGVVVEDTRGATLEELVGAGLLSDAEAVAGGEETSMARIPTRELIAVHAVAHGLVQHGATPKAYPMSRLFADLIDLGFGARGADAATMGPLAPWIPDLAPEDVAALDGLCEWLAAGAIPDAPDRCQPLREGARRLRDHWLAGVFEPSYGEALKLVAAGSPSGRRWTHWRRHVGAAWQALFLTRSQIDSIYGKPRSRWGYVGRYLWRPFDLLLRVRRARAARRALDHR